MRYPHERYVRLLLAGGDSTDRVLNECGKHRLYFHRDTAVEDLVAIKERMCVDGGATMRRRMEEGPPRKKDGTVRAVPPRTLAKAVGVQDGLADPRLMEVLETILEVKPMRRTIELLASKGLDAAAIAHEMSTRFQSSITPRVVQTYCTLYWDVSDMDTMELYRYIGCWNDKEKDKPVYMVCLGKPLQYVHWRLGNEDALQWNERGFITTYLAGLERQLLNSVDPTLNPDGEPDVATFTLYQNARDVYYDMLERNNEDAFHDFVGRLHHQIKLKKSDPPKLPVIGDMEHVG